MVGLTDTLRDEEVHALIEDTVIRRVEGVPLAPLAGRALEMMTAQDRHHELLDTLVRGLDRALAEHRDDLRARFGRESPWWVPEPIDGRIFEKLFEGLRKLLQEIAADPRHELRMEFDKRVRALAGSAERVSPGPPGSAGFSARPDSESSASRLSTEASRRACTSFNMPSSRWKRGSRA